MQIAYSSPFANPMRGRMAAPGFNTATGQFQKPDIKKDPFAGTPLEGTGGIRPANDLPISKKDPFAGTPLEGTGGIRPANDLPISILPEVISDDTGFGPHPPAPLPPPPPETGGPTPPPISQPPRRFGGNQFGGIGGFFNQLAMMSPEQYSMGMDRYQRFNHQFGPSMGGGYGMFNQLAQMTPEQYNMGMDRFQRFNKQFGGFPPQNVAPPPMMPQPQFNQYGGGFGGQRFQPQILREQQMPRPQFNQYGGGFGGQRFQPPMMPRPQFNQFGGGFGGFNQAPNPFGGSFNSPLRQFMGPQILPFNMQPMMGQPQTSTPMPPPNMTPTQGQPQTSIPMPPPPGGMMATTNPDGTTTVGAGGSAPAVQNPNLFASFDAGEPMTNMAQSGGGALF